MFKKLGWIEIEPLLYSNVFVISLPFKRKDNLRESTSSESVLEEPQLQNFTVNEN